MVNPKTIGLRQRKRKPGKKRLPNTVRHIYLKKKNGDLFFSTQGPKNYGLLDKHDPKSQPVFISPQVQVTADSQ